MNRTWVVYCLSILVVLPGGGWEAWAQQSGEASPRVPVELASEEIRRFVSLSTAAGQALNVGADAALDKLVRRPEGKTAGAVLERVARLYFVTLPIAAGSHFAAHEFGHLSRSREAGGRDHRLEVTLWPWPVPVMGGLLHNTVQSQSGYGPTLGVLAGGAEAALVQEQGLLRHIYREEETHYFNWILLVYAKLEMPLYTWADSTKRGPLKEGRPADPRDYAARFGPHRSMTYSVGQSDSGQSEATNFVTEGNRAFQSIRRGMWLNLADYALIAGLTGVIEYIRTGHRYSSVPALKMGSWSIVPGARFSLTGVGIETAVDIGLRGAGHLSHLTIRSTETITGERAWGVGIDVTSGSVRRWRPEARIDLFQRAGDAEELLGILPGLGARFETGVQAPLRMAERHFDTHWRVGYKTPGHLVDAPDRRTLLAGMTIGVRF